MTPLNTSISSETSQETSPNSAAGLTPSLDDHAQKQALLNAYIEKLKAAIAQKTLLARNKYYAKKKNRAAMKKNSQKICRQHDKKFLKRQAKRQAKLVKVQK